MLYVLIAGVYPYFLIGIDKQAVLPNLDKEN